MSHPLKVLALMPCLPATSPGQRFRIEQWAPYLEREGVQFTFVPFEDEALHQVLYQPGHHIRKAVVLLNRLCRRLLVPPLARQYDLIYLYREACMLGPAIVERLLVRTGIPIVYDFDDPIWMPYRSPTNGMFTRLKCLGKTESICRMATAVMVGNQLLAAWASQFSNQVHVVPSTIEMGQYPLRPDGNGKTDMLTLGWTGSHSTLPFLQLLEKPLQRLSERQNFRLLVISHTDQPNLGWTVGNLRGKKWQAATEAVDLHDIDIGLAPFPDTGWTPWRCHGKVLQYMAIGIPTVASRIGILPEYIRDGEEGFLAGSDNDWIEKLALLLEDAALRKRLGEQGRRRIQERYSAAVWAPRVRAIFEDVVAARKSHKR